MRLFVYFVALIFYPLISVANWSVINTGIDDDFNGVWFWGNNGILTGNKGLYYTNSGGATPSSWTRFTVSNNQQDSLLIERCRFNKVSSPATNWAYIAATDTINHVGVIFYFNASSHYYSIEYIGPANSSLNWIGYSYSGSSRLVAAGDNGFCVYSVLASQTYSVVDLNTLSDFSGATIVGTTVYLSTDTVLYKCFDIGGVLEMQVSKTFPQRHFNCLYRSPTNQLFTGDSVYSFVNENTFDLQNITLFNYGNLNVRDISEYLIATDHGVFKKYNNDHLEYFPTTTGFVVNDVVETGSYGYAACNNGHYMKIPFSYDYTMPYPQMRLTVKCLGQNCVFTSIPDGGTVHTWLVDGVNIGSGGTISNYNFVSVGNHTITLVSSNSAPYQDSIATVIMVVDTPSAIIPVYTSDTIICHAGQVNINLDSSETGFDYVLKRLGSNSEYGSVFGDGNALTFLSGVIDSTGIYYIEAQSIVSQCKVTMNDSLKIKSEETKAKLHCTYLNSELNEATLFLNNSNDAQNYLWDFGNSSNNQFQTTMDAVSSFDSVGVPIIKLKVWSDHNCFDSTTFAGLVIYEIDPEQNDSCWAMPIYGYNQYRYSTKNIAMQPDGFVVSGCYNNQIFPSKYGQIFHLPNTGGYVAKYDKNGVLKWIDYDSYTGGATPSVVSIGTDSKNNIYITGNCRSPFHFNDGDSLMLRRATDMSYSSYIVKMDSLGRFKYDRYINGYYSTNDLVVKKSGEIMVSGIFFDYYPDINSFDSIKFINPDSNSVIHFAPSQYDYNYSRAYGIIIDSLGNYCKTINCSVLGNTASPFIEAFGTNYNYFSNYEVNGPLYFWCDTSNMPLYLNNNERRYIMQLDSSFSINRNLYFKNPYWSYNDQTGFYVQDMKADKDDNIYLQVMVIGSGEYFYYFNGDNDSIAIPWIYRGIVVKIDKNGNLKWINGVSNISPSKIYYNENDSTILVATSYENNSDIRFYHSPGDTGSYTTISGLAYPETFLSRYNSNGELLQIKRATERYNVSYTDMYPQVYEDNSKRVYLYTSAREFFSQSSLLSANEFGDTINIVGTGNENFTPIIGVCNDLSGINLYTINIESKSQTKNSYEINIYPNPNNGKYFIRVPENFNGTLDVFSSIGELLIEKQKVTQEVLMDMGYLNSGIYLIRLKDKDGKVFTGRVAINK